MDTTDDSWEDRVGTCDSLLVASILFLSTQQCPILGKTKQNFKPEGKPLFRGHGVVMNSYMGGGWEEPDRDS